MVKLGNCDLKIKGGGYNFVCEYCKYSSKMEIRIER